MSGSPHAPGDWYDGFFEGDWLEQVALYADPERTQEQIEFIVEQLALERGARVLDLACGHGRITLALARRGYRMTGLDLSPRSLQLARDAAARQGLAVDWVQADMREIPAGAGFDAIISFFTSFGYFQEEHENQRVLDGVARALGPGGRFLIDVVNLLGLTRRYRERAWEERDGVVWLQEHEYDILAGRNRAVWTFVRPDGTRSELVHSLRTYAPHELAAMLGRAGLEVKGAWGGFDGSELSFDSWRLILLARKR
jgi:SAM-dependent methyltransferase